MLALSIAGAIALPGTARASLPNYVVVDLGTLDRGTSSSAHAINASGQVAGWSNYANGWVLGDAFMSDLRGMHDLGLLPGDPAGDTIGTGINDAGQVVGHGLHVGNNRAFLYDSAGLHDLGTLGGQNADAWAINNAGRIVGDAQLPDSPDGRNGARHAFLYDGSGMHDLGTLGGTDSVARAINIRGQVVGDSSGVGALSDSAFLWENGVMKDLGGLPGCPFNGAYGINDAGRVVGVSGSGSWAHAFLYDSTGMHDLGTLGGPDSAASGINGLGEVVGSSRISADQTQHAFIYTGGVMTDLNSLLPANSGWVLTEADAINDAGQIVGSGMFNGQQRAFLLTFPSDPRLFPPAAPSGLSVRMASTSELDLSWTDNSNNAHGFEVQVRKSDGQWVTIGLPPANQTTWAHTGLSADTHYTYRVRAVNDVGSSGWSNEAGGDTGVHPHADLSPAGPLDFGSQTVSTPSAAQTVTIANSGNAPLTISSLTVSGTNASEFAIVPPVSTPETVAPGESLPISLVFTPAGIGPRSATLTVADDAPAGPSTVTLTGSGFGSVLQLTPAALDFGAEPVGLNGTLAVLLQNTGNAPLTIGKLAFKGAEGSDFSLATDDVTGRTLQPGGITLLNVRFSPTATGSRSAALAILGDTSDGQQLLPLTGVGTEPLLRLSADSLLFAVQPAGSSSAATQTLTLTNNGDAPLAIQSLNLSGPDAASFHLVSDTGEPSLNPDQSRTLTISFSPATTAGLRARIAAVSYKAALEIQHNDPHPDAPHTVTLFASTDAGPTGIPIHPLPPTSLAPTTPPAAPSGLSAHAPSAGEVDLAWSDNSSDEQAFAIWRTGGGQDWARVGIMGPHATSYADTTVQPGVSYTYKVRAVNGGGASNWSNTVVLTPGAPPAAPTGLTASPAGNGVTLTWSSNSSDEQAFAIWRSGGGADWARVGIAGPGTTSYTDTGATPNTAYSYQVRAINRFGASDWSNTVSITAGASVPAAPAGLVAGDTGEQVTLTWTNQTTDQQALAIWRQGGGQDWARIGIMGPHATSYTDATVSPNTAYSYKVRAVNGSGASDWSNVVTLTTGAAPPAAPAGLAASVTGGQVTLTWTNPSPDAHALAIWRTGGGQDWARVGIADPQVTSYTDAGLAAGVSYTYRVRAIGAGGASGWSNEVSVQVPAAR